MQPDIEAWKPWHPRDLAARLKGAGLTWFVAGGWAIDIFLGERTRDHEDLKIALPWLDPAAVPGGFRGVGGREIPYLKPEICLLFKSKAVRDKDQADFEATLPRMSPVQRIWLHTALERVHPGHDWISATGCAAADPGQPADPCTCPPGCR
jgi:hypothetical protein